MQRITLALALMLALVAVAPATSLRVLGLFPHPAISHWRFFEPVLHGLADAGHDVTVVGLFPWKNGPANYRDIVIPGEVLTNAIDLQDEWFVNRRKFGRFYEVNFAIDWGTVACANAYNSSGLQQILRQREQFDVIIMEHFNTDCLMGVAWHLQAPVISMSSCALMPWHYDRFGQPHIPSYIPSLFQPGSEQMSFAGRLQNWVDIQLWRFLYRVFVNTYTDVLLRQQFGEHIPAVDDLVKTTSLMFVNQHYSLSGSKPLSPAVVEIGGIHIAPEKPIPANLKQYLDEAVDGVILVSWGSMVRATSLPDDKRESMVQAFRGLKQRVLWKWENDTLPGKPKNVRIVKWLPQRDILCHPNVRVFVSHGGLMGSSEAAHCGVPAVLTPMYGDQFMNSAAFVNRGMGAVVNYEELDRDTFLGALRKMLRPEARENARQVAYAFNNRLRPANETAQWWVEHVARSGGSPLTKSYSVHMSAWTYHSLDVIALLSLVLVAIVGSWVWVLRRCLCSSAEETPQRKRKVH